MKVTILGSGTSAGVPIIGCGCAVCRSTDPHDARTRPSILIDLGDGRRSRYLLVDTSTDLRTQALANDVRRVDAILYTHAHADHVMGLDDIRRFNALQGGPIPCYADPHTLGALQRTFHYVFHPPPQIGGGIPQLTLVPIEGPFTVGGVDIVPVPVLHGRLPILGFRIGPFAYVTDASAIPDASWPLLDGVRVLVLNALRDRPHPTHFTLSEALDVVDRVGAERAYFTHICHDLPHEATCARLPAHVRLAYDGLTLQIG